MSPNFDNVDVYELKCNFNKLYIGKTNKIFKTRYKEYISEIKLKKVSPNSNFAWRVLENNHKKNLIEYPDKLKK